LCIYHQRSERGWTLPDSKMGTDHLVELGEPVLDAVLAELTPAVIGLAGDGSITYASPPIEALIGHAPEAVVGESVASFVHPDDLTRVVEGLARWEGRPGNVTGPKLRLRHRSGRWVDTLADVVAGPDAAPMGDVIAILRPRTLQSETEQKLRQLLYSQDRVARIARLFVDRSAATFGEGVEAALAELGTLEYVTRVLVYRTEGDELVQSAEWSAPRDAPTESLPRRIPMGPLPMIEALARLEEVRVPSVEALDDTFEVERDFLRRAGVVSCLALPMASNGEFRGFVSFEVTIWEVAFDPVHLAALRAAAAVLVEAYGLNDALLELVFQARHDAVTGLLNREAFLEEVDAALRCSTDDTSLLLIDIDGFKVTNDALGHAAGDELLHTVGQRLADGSPEGAVTGRLGGDEFGCLLSGSPSTTYKTAGEMIENTCGPVILAGAPHRVSARASIVHGGDLGTGTPTGENLLAAGEFALAGVQAGKALRRYDAEQAERAAKRRWIDAELPQALRAGNLELYYQPEVDTGSGAIGSVEALLRWNHPDRGLLAAGSFVPQTEGEPIFREVSDWVITKALVQLAVWRDAFTELEVRVNLSGADLVRPGLTERIDRRLRDIDVPPSSVCVEVTETAALVDFAAAKRELEQLSDLGVRVAVDDFGTGHWSVRSLFEIPVDLLKIDKVIVDSVDTSAASRNLVVALLDIAHELGASVVAEGVERVSQRDVLAELGCTRAQGFLFHRPLRVPDATSVLKGAPVRGGDRP